MKENIFCNQSLSEAIPCPAEIVQVYTNEPATNLKATTIVTYLRQVLLLNFMKKLRRYHRNHGYNLAKLFPVYTSELSSSQKESDSELKNLCFLRALLLSRIRFQLHISRALYILSYTFNTKLSIGYCSRRVSSRYGDLQNLFFFWSAAILSLCLCFILLQYSRREGYEFVRHCCSCINCLTEKDDIAALQKDVTRDPLKTECAYNILETPMKR